MNFSPRNQIRSSDSGLIRWQKTYGFWSGQLLHRYHKIFSKLIFSRKKLIINGSCSLTNYFWAIPLQKYFSTSQPHLALFSEINFHTIVLLNDKERTETIFLILIIFSKKGNSLCRIISSLSRLLFSCFIPTLEVSFPCCKRKLIVHLWSKIAYRNH